MKDGDDYNAAFAGFQQVYLAGVLKGYQIGLGHPPTEEELTTLHQSLVVPKDLPAIVRSAFNVDDPPKTDPQP